ncbi:MHYT domain-containing protein [Dinoroseobacter sp. S124A]|uniref:MHYT domain-containing protein n=1 Tax=Dinoroseobacter sp. S124A TaxID=3415128 RepID=UPI003C7C22E5
MLEVSHNEWLVVASLAVALMAGFTGLSLTKGASALPAGPRKTRVAMAAVALGGGIWAMHFVAMLGLQLPILFYYDPLITLISALVAILIVGVALLILHFLPRSRQTITLAGVCVGLGIPVMHYIGMSGMRLCQPDYTLLGLLEAGAASILLGVAAIWIAYGERTYRNILLGTLFFGLAVFAVHFVAMYGTSFTAIEGADAAGPLISNATLALIVAVIAFVICGAFLLSSVTLLPAVEAQQRAAEAQAGDPEPAPEPDTLPDPELTPQIKSVPYELDGKTFFIDSRDVTAIRAEGHYTILYRGTQKLFCPWSISDAEARLPRGHFVRAHRSYLVNPAHVTGFERKKDNGVVFFDAAGALEKVPVSRSRLQDVRLALGLV